VVDARRVARGHGAAASKRRLERGQLLRRGVGTRMLVALELADRDELVVEPAGVGCGRPALLRAERERVLLLAAHMPALGDVLTGLAHRLERDQLLHRRVRKAPAERGVVEHAVATRECTVG